MRLIVCNDWAGTKSAIFTNKDGFLKMLQILRDEFGWEVTFIKKGIHGDVKHDCVDIKFVANVKEEVLKLKPDAILFFSDLSRPILGEFEEVKIPKAMCFTGGEFMDYAHIPDILFVESSWWFDKFKKAGLNVKRAFGTNTEVFKVIPQPKIFDAVFPATFAAWKRHNLFAEAMGRRGLVCGYWQPHEPHCVEVCQKHNVAVLNHQTAESVALIYNMAHTCVITSEEVGGSQRTVLEAMAIGIPPIVMTDSTKTSEYVLESGFGLVIEPDSNKIRAAVDELIKNPQDPQKGIDYIKSKYTARHYALAVKEGIESICSK